MLCWWIDFDGSVFRACGLCVLGHASSAREDLLVDQISQFLWEAEEVKAWIHARCWEADDCRREGLRGKIVVHTIAVLDNGCSFVHGDCLLLRAQSGDREIGVGA